MLKESFTIYILSLVLLLVPFLSKGQQVEFSQFYSAPLHLNPALAGVSYGPRLALTYRNQWPGISGSFVTQSVSYDQRLGYNKGGGVGLIVFLVLVMCFLFLS